MTQGSAIGIGLFLLCVWPLMMLCLGVFLGRRVRGVRSPFVMDRPAPRTALEKVKETGEMY